jgi:hypothetical protein
MLKIPAEFDRETLLAKLIDISHQVSPRFTTRCLCQRPLEDGSGIIRTQMETNNRSGNGCSAWDALYNTTL